MVFRKSILPINNLVIVPHNCHYNQNGWLKYDHRVMYKKYTTPCPHMGCGVVERHLEMAQPKKPKINNLVILGIGNFPVNASSVNYKN